MNYPKQIKARRKIDALTGIKSSLDNLRSVISLVYLLYIANGRKASVRYSIPEGTKIKIAPELLNTIEDLLGRNNLERTINNNPLITNQYEPLYVGVTLLMKLGFLKMEGWQNTAERTGGVRYPKQLYFANNTLVMDLILQGFPEKVRKLSLYEWLHNSKASNSEFEERVCKFLTTCTFFTQFKLRDNSNSELFFQTEGIYKALIEDDGDVIYSDSHEFVGPTRIYNNVLKEGLEPWIGINKSVLNLKDGNNPNAESISQMLSTTLDIYNVKDDALLGGDIEDDGNIVAHNRTIDIQNITFPYLTAIRTKPFLLLAGISGTGKSRIVRELAFKSCPKYLQDKDGTTPGNYCMIEVKPNWHDSTELLGYYSRLGQAGYQFKKFVMFLVKAKMFPKVPFFVCLDEMNLAPVEHYFAEILSILETRKHPKIAGTSEVDMDVIKTDPIVEARYFRELGKVSNTRNTETGQAYSTILTDRDIYMKLYGIDTESDIDPEVGKRTELTAVGLTLPDNVIIIGTVNMDDTTHQFSRKVIDRAMTIEMNGGKLSDMYGGSHDLEYLDEAEQQKWQTAFKQRYVTADEVLKEHSEVADKIVEKVPGRLDKINEALKGTPFEVSYRVLNELTIMIGVMLDEKTDGESLDTIIDKAVDRILLMKILPRMEGDADMFRLSQEFKRKNDITFDNRLEWLKERAPQIENTEREGHQQTAREKIQEMIERLENQEFTRFWP